MKFLSLILLVLVVSCSSVSNPEKVELVEDLQVKLKAVTQTYNNVEIEKVKAAYDTYNKNMDQISKYYNPDEVPEDVAALIDLYKAVKKGGKKIKGEYEQLGTQIELTSNQLEDLKTDIANDLLNKSEMEEYIEQESKNVEVIQSTVATLYYNYEYMLNVHDSISYKVQNVLLENVETP